MFLLNIFFLFVPQPAISRPSVRPCVIKFVSMISYKPVVGISTILQLGCSYKDRDEFVRFWGQRSKGKVTENQSRSNI